MIIKVKDGQEVICKTIILDDKDALADGRYLIPLSSIQTITEDEIE